MPREGGAAGRYKVREVSVGVVTGQGPLSSLAHVDATSRCPVRPKDVLWGRRGRESRRRTRIRRQKKITNLMDWQVLS